MSYSSYSSSVYLPRLSLVNKILLITSGSMFFLQSVLKVFFGFALESLLGFTPRTFLHGHMYQLFTFPFLQTDLMSFMFNGMLLWFIGSELEHAWGRKSYLKFLVASLLGEAFTYVGLVYLLFLSSPRGQFPLIGLHGMSFALLLAYGVIYKERILTFMLIFPMKAKYFCMIIVGIELYMGLFTPFQIAAWGHLGAFLTAYLFLRLFVFKKSKNFGRIGPFSKSPKKVRQHLRLVDVDKDNKNNDSNFGDGPKIWQ